VAGRFSIEAVFKAIDRVTAPVSKMQNRIGKFTRGVQRGFRSVNRSLDNLVTNLRSAGTKAIGVATIAMTGLTAATIGFIKQASLIEDATAAFTPLLGGVKRAEELVSRLNKTAASTPFQFETLSGAASQLLPTMQGDINNTIKTLRMLGDTAGGNAQKLDSITRGFTKAMLKGKVDMESLNMIAEAGVPVFTELAAAMGEDVGEDFFKMISKGEVATDDLIKAFERMTTKGGIFFKGMEIASRTQSGLFSTLKDNIALTAAAIGQQILPISKQYTMEAIKIAQQIREWVLANQSLIGQRLQDSVAFITENFRNFLQVARGVVTIIGAIVATSLTLKTVMLASAIATKAWAAAMAVLKGVMFAVNVVMRLGPIGAILMLIGLAALLITNWDKVVTAITAGIDFLKQPFEDIISGLTAVFSSARRIFGGGGEAEVVTPQDRTAQVIEERRQTGTAELTIRDESGRAELTQTNKVPGIDLQLAESGAF
jgi:tape measure domain-containing protein